MSLPAAAVPTPPAATHRRRRSLLPLQGLPPRKADPGRIRIHEQMPEGAKQDAEYLKMVQDVSTPRRRLPCPSAPAVASCPPRAAPPPCPHSLPPPPPSPTISLQVQDQNTGMRGCLFAQGAFDRGDLLYLRNEEEKRRHVAEEMEEREHEEVRCIALRCCVALHSAARARGAARRCVLRCAVRCIVLCLLQICAITILL